MEGFLHAAGDLHFLWESGSPELFKKRRPGDMKNKEIIKKYKKILNFYSWIVRFFFKSRT